MEEQAKEMELAVVNLEHTNINITNNQIQQKAIQKCIFFQSRSLFQFLRLVIYFFVAFAIFSIFIRKNQINFGNEKLFDNDKLANSEQMRGLFPAVMGEFNSILGQWKVVFTSSFEKQVKTKEFQQYLIEFKTNDHLRIMRKDCSGDLMMNWKTYSFNMHISEYDSTQIDDQMIIKPHPQDIKCIRQTEIFFINLKFSSIWSIFDERLYILIQKWKSQAQTNLLQVLILQKVKQI